MRLDALRVALAVAGLLIAAGASAGPAVLRQGLTAFAHEDYVRAAGVFLPLAAAGDAVAQAHLGLQYETGRGVPMNYGEAARWYRRAAEQGHSGAQFALGLLYNRGQGVPRDHVEASVWLNRATAAAPPASRAARARIRDAVTTTMTRGEIAQARSRALHWVPTRTRGL